jgi:Na+/melibiose symporter-like transporter
VKEVSFIFQILPALKTEKPNDSKSEESTQFCFCRNQNFIVLILLLPIAARRNGNKQKDMKIKMITICYVLGAILPAASIHEISAHDHHHSEEIDDFQIDVDQEIDVVSCYLLVDTTISLICLLFCTTCSPHLVAVT